MKGFNEKSFLFGAWRVAHVLFEVFGWPVRDVARGVFPTVTLEFRWFGEIGELSSALFLRRFSQLSYF